MTVTPETVTHVLLADHDGQPLGEPVPWDPAVVAHAVRAAGGGTVALTLQPPDGPLVWDGVPVRVLPCRVVGDAPDPLQWVRGDQPLVTVGADEAAAVYPATPRPLADIRRRRIAESKDRAADLLAKTDWYITRRAETGTPVPDAILAARAAVRASQTAHEAWVQTATADDLGTMAGAPQIGVEPA